MRRATAHQWITPNRLTWTAVLVGLGAAAAFAQGTRWWLVVGALAYYVSFVIDCMDGKLARLTRTGSVFGQWLDFMLDRLLVVVCATALMLGQYAYSNDWFFLVLGAIVIFLNMFHQLNGQVMAEALRKARGAIEVASGEAPARDPFASFPAETRRRLSQFLRLREALTRRRIRADLFSTIEFQMAVFFVGPLTGEVAIVTAVACALLVLFEIANVAKFAVAARTLQRRLTAAEPPTVPANGHMPTQPGERAPALATPE